MRTRKPEADSEAAGKFIMLLFSYVCDVRLLIVEIKVYDADIGSA